MKCLFTEMIFIYKNVMGMGKRKGNKRKDPRLVAFPSPLSRYGRQTVFWCPRIPKTSRTYPKWGGGCNLMGQKKNKNKKNKTYKTKKQSRTRWGQVAWIYSDEVPRSSEKVGWSKGWSIKNRNGKILEAYNLVTGMMTHKILLTRD